MDRGEEAAAEQAAILADARRREAAWLSGSPDPARAAAAVRLPSPFRLPQPLWADSPPADPPGPDWPPCPRCAAPSLDRHSVVEGCRHNGDGWGLWFEVCPQCGWTVWGRYDEA